MKEEQFLEKVFQACSTATSTTTEICCRDAEIKQINEVLRDALSRLDSDGTSSTTAQHQERKALYVGGSPGTGKTLTVNRVLTDLRQSGGV